MESNWDSEYLQKNRQLGDPLADELVASVLKTGDKDTWAVTRLFGDMSRNDSPVPDELPAAMKAYFCAVELPPWADQEKIERGENLFSRFGVEIVMLLFCKALPMTYTCGKGAAVLVHSGRMTQKTLNNGENFSVINRRVMETAQFILNVMAPGGFEPGGKGLRTAQKIRLIHACIRYFLVSSGWDSKVNGLPINQEDIAGTLMSFSYAMIEGLEQMGLDVSLQDKEAYLHCWNVVGYFIGLREDLMPTDLESARQLTDAILKHQSEPSQAGVTLTQSLLGYMGSMMPFGLGRSIPPLLMRQFIGDTMADYLGIRRVSKLETWVVKHLFWYFFEDVDDVEKCSHWLGHLGRRASRKLLQSLVIEKNNYKKVDFFMPPSLRTNWNL
mgnify:CR=1 FL=1